MSDSDIILGIFLLSLNLAMVIFPILWWLQVNDEMKRYNKK